MIRELYGDPVKQEVENYIISSVNEFKSRGIYPKLAVIRAGEDPGQIYYEKAIIKQSDAYGIESQVINFSANTSQTYLNLALQAVNADEEVHGIIMLRPFPQQIDEEALRHMLNPSKDVDAITDISIAETFVGKKDAFMACTAEACMEVIRHYDIDIQGKRVAVIGRSLTVGKPLSMMLMNKNATVTVCHSHTSKEDTINICKASDIVVLATGQTQNFGSEYFRDGHIILDVGTGTGKDGKMHGDLNIEEILETGEITDLSYTPVPGGIGKVTTALLLRNIIKAANKRNQ